MLHSTFHQNSMLLVMFPKQNWKKITIWKKELSTYDKKKRNDEQLKELPESGKILEDLDCELGISEQTIEFQSDTDSVDAADDTSSKKLPTKSPPKKAS